MSYHKKESNNIVSVSKRRRSVPKRLARIQEFQPYSNIEFRYDENDESGGFQIFLKKLDSNESIEKTEDEQIDEEIDKFDNDDNFFDQK